MTKDMSRSKNYCTVLIIFLFIMLPAIASSRTFDTVVGFGDSLTDHGGLQSYLGVYDPVSNPNGALEVWSNGDTWIEYFVAELGATLDNNAIAGAMSLGHESATVQSYSDAGVFPQLGLVGQVNTYVSGEPSFAASETLFTIWIGGNDFLEFGRGEMATNDPYEMIENAMANISTAINALYQGGARNFLIINLPVMSATPSYNTRPEEEINQVMMLTAIYNHFLKELASSLNASLTDSSIYYYDVFYYMEIVLLANTFADSTTTYMELDALGNKTGNVNGPAENYFFWDSIHPTTKAHEIVGKDVAEFILAADDDDDDSTCFISYINKSTDLSGTYSLCCILTIIIVGFAAVFTNRKVISSLTRN